MPRRPKIVCSLLSKRPWTRNFGPWTSLLLEFPPISNPEISNSQCLPPGRAVAAAPPLAAQPEPPAPCRGAGKPFNPRISRPGYASCIKSLKYTPWKIFVSHPRQHFPFRPAERARSVKAGVRRCQGFGGTSERMTQPAVDVQPGRPVANRDDVADYCAKHVTKENTWRNVKPPGRRHPEEADFKLK